MAASRQLGKLRQWAGEVIAAREKTSFSEEFRELERDIEFRREGARRLYLATETYQKYLSKKKLNDALDEAEKLLPIDALGVVMIVHGEEYPDDSIFGNSLVKLGRSHCKIATLQETFALGLKDSVLTFLSRFEEEIKEYDAIRKKLESRRLSYDAALAKVEKYKNGKKEKERREAEEELERAQYRYEETMEDVRAHMQAIQENEAAQHRELTTFLDAEINHAQQSLDVLLDVKSQWPTKSNHVRKRGSLRGQARPQRQTKYSSLRVPSSIHNDPAPPQDSSDDGDSTQLPARPNSLRRRKSESGMKAGSLPSSRPTSRAPSRLSRKRSNSTETVGERVKEAEKDKSKRMTVADWASNAVESVASITRRNKDKERFSALQDESDDHEGHGTVRRSGSFTEPKTRMEKQRKVVRALSDFQGSLDDELSFKAGDEIIVLNEVLDEWWLGSINSQTGLFPSTLVETIPGKLHQIGSEDEGAHHSRPNAYGVGTSDDDTDLNRKPLSPHRGPFFADFSDIGSIASSGREDEDSDLVRQRPNADDDIDSKWANFTPPPLPMRRRSTTTDINAFTMPSSLTSGVLTKRPVQPPPPPPRRLTTVATMTPPIPERKLQSFLSTPTKTTAQDDQQGSPFDSASDFTSHGTTTPVYQNPF